MVDVLVPIAVVGLDCRFPGAADVEQFWLNLVSGRESVSVLTEEQLRSAGVSPETLANPDFVRAASTMPSPDLFDPSLFGMTRREAELCDPQFRAFLETCHGALEHAGYDPFGMLDSVGVFGSVSPNGYLTHNLARVPDLLSSARMLISALNQPDYLATQVAYRLDLRGPAMTVLTACSSALAAVHLACQALRAGECDMALAGGAAIRVPLEQGYMWTPGGVTSRDGHCRPFDAAAGGTVFGNGAGTVALKRLDDALAAGDDVKAVVLGSAMNNDGADKVSFSAPSLSGQAAAVIEAMVLAGAAPADIGYVEAHATGTELGDPVEVAALAEAYARLNDGPLPTGTCLLGSVKANIGHLDNAAGIAGFIKAVLALERGAIPGTANLREVNPRLELEKTPFRVDPQLTPWRRESGSPRFAAVTSLGVGGTNVHAVLREGPVSQYQPADGRPRVLVWSAGGSEAEGVARGRLADYFHGRGAQVFPDAAATLQHGRTAHRFRGAAVCASGAEAASALSGVAGAPPVFTGEAVDDCRVAYLVSGQGTQQVRMATGLYGAVRPFTVAMDECLELFEDSGVPLYRRWLDGADAAEFADPTLTQPLLFSVGYALGTTWTQWGVPPAAVVGHSLGEITAAALAGVFRLPEAVRLVALRASAMAAHPVSGGMLAVGAGEEAVRPLITEPLCISAVNGARQVVVSGPDAELEILAARLGADGISARRVPTFAAYHHPEWAAAVQEWDASLGPLATQPARVPFFSAAGGGVVGDTTLARPSFWTGQLTKPVRFDAALGELLREGPHVLLEIGPGGTLAGLARRHPAAGGAVAVPSLRDGRQDQVDLLSAAAQLWTAGCRLDWAGAEQLAPAVRPPLPGYPHERVRCWVEPPAEAAVTRDAAPVVVTEDPAVNPITEIGWLERPAAALPGPAVGPARHALVLLPADQEDRAMAVLLAVQRAGMRPIRVSRRDRSAAGAGQTPEGRDQLEHLEAVLTDLAARGTTPEAVIYASSIGPGDDGAATDRLAAELADLLAVCRLVLSSKQWPAPPRLVLLTTGAVDVSGAEPLVPEAAALPALLRTLHAEAPEIACSAVDFDAAVPVDALAAGLADAGDVLVALRGRRRWIPVERPYRLPDVAGTVLREQGTYLITGGTGGLGLAVAAGLAGTGLRPRLALLGRRGATEEATDAVDELRALGAEVHVYACDVTDRSALDRVLDDVSARMGPVNGLLHLAGVPGTRMIAFRETADAMRVLAPKANGWAGLERAFATRPRLDFAVHFSSRAAFEGLVGGGDYAVANAFVDAAAIGSPLAGGRALSIGWPVWADVGMAARADVDISGIGRTVRELGAGRGPELEPEPEPDEPVLVRERELSAATHWALDEHRFGRVPLLPATGQLDLLVQTYREMLEPDGAALRLSEVVFRAPLLAKEPRIVRLSFRADTDGHAATIESRPKGGGPWTLHTTAQVGVHADPRPARVDIDELRHRFDAAGDSYRPRANATDLVFGPRWHNVAAAQSLTGELLLRIELPSPYLGDLEQHPLHPALLDTATGALRSAGRGDLLPFLYQRLVTYADLPSRFYAHLRLDDAPADNPTCDIDVVTDEGEVLLSIVGFTMRVVDAGKLVRAEGAAPDPGRRTAPAADRAAGLTPDAGVDLLLRLLDARCAGSVLVRPFSGGRPVPTASAPPASAPPVAARVAGPPSPAEIAAPVVSPPADELRSLDDRIGALWSRVLGVTAIQPDQDFFDAGGDSLSAVELMAQVRKVLGVQLSIGVLLEVRTYRKLVAALRERGAE